MKTAATPSAPANILSIEQQPLEIPEMVPAFKNEDEVIAFYTLALAQAVEKKAVSLRAREREQEAALQATRRELAATTKGNKAVRTPGVPDEELFARALPLLKKDKGISGSDVAKLMGLEGNQRIPTILSIEAGKTDGKVRREGVAKSTRYFLK